MPTALERLLTSPSARGVLRACVHHPDLSSTCLPSVYGCKPAPSFRRDSSSHPRNSSYPPRDIQSPGQVHKDTDGALSTEAEKTKNAYPRFKIARFFNLDHESNLNSERLHKQRSLRIDRAEDCDKPKLWAQALQYRERVYGPVGVRQIYLGMERRGFCLPLSATLEARILWTTFIKHPQLVVPVIDHATSLYRETGKLYPHLYEECMAHWLPRHPRKALELHHQLVVGLRLRKLPLRQLAHRLRTKMTERSLAAFMEIYRTSNERDLYDVLVPSLCDLRKTTLARRWHIICLQRKDAPSSSSALHPMIQLFTAEMSALAPSDTESPIEQNNSTTAKHVPASDSTQKSRYNLELLRRFTGRDIAPVRFDDTFCARLFATRAVSPASVIRGLVMVGVNEIGPQALRAMAARSDPISELLERFEELKQAGIALQSSVFSLALEKFAMEGKFYLVRSILESDQHPDVFGDAELQKKLLHFYLKEEDWPQAYRTLAILALFHDDVSTESWNLLLQAHIKTLIPERVMQTLRDMTSHGVFVSGESMAAIRHILRHRRKSRRAVRSTDYSLGQFDDLRFVARVYIMISQSGIGNVYPLAWRELIRRFGMLGRFRELRRLLSWILSWYAPRDSPAFSRLPRSPFLDSATARLRKEYPERFQYFNLRSGLPINHPANPVQQLFPASMQQGLVVWGFRAGLLPTAPWEQSMLSGVAWKKHSRRRFVQSGVLQRLKWSKGLQTLVELRDRGVPVAPETVVKTMNQMFRVLFGSGRSSRRENRIMEDVNKIPYEEYVREVNRIWGAPLLRENNAHGDEERVAAKCGL